MKIIWLVGGLILVVALLMTMNIKEGFTDSELTNNINELNNVKNADSNSSEKNKPMKDMKINWGNHETLVRIVDKYDEGDIHRRLKNHLTISEAVSKLNYRKSHN